jgi:hypothetical protein
MMCIIAQVRPYANQAVNRLLMANEFITLICAVIMLMASSPNVEPLHRRYLGFSILGLMAVMTLYNLIFVLISSYSDTKHYYMNKKVEAFKEKYFNSIKPGTIMPGVRSILEEVIAEVSEYDSEDEEGPRRVRRRRGKAVETYEDDLINNRKSLGFSGGNLLSAINGTETDVIYGGDN